MAEQTKLWEEMTEEEQNRAKEMERMELEELQKRLGVSSEDAWGMIKVLIKAGYGKSHFAFLTQSGQTYSLAFDEIQADFFNAGEI